MINQINKGALRDYAKNFTLEFSANFFRSAPVVKGAHLTTLCSVNQVNFFVIQILFEKWHIETQKIKSPYFNFSAAEVQEAFVRFKNILSNHIAVEQYDFEPLLEEACYRALLLTFDPEDYYEEMLDHWVGETVYLMELENWTKYLKINPMPIDKMVQIWQAEHIQQMSVADTRTQLHEVISHTSWTTPDTDTLIEEYSRVFPLNLEKLSQPQEEDAVSGLPLAENDKLLGEIETLHDQLTKGKPVQFKTLGDRLKEKNSRSIAESISLNDRFMFTNELFGGSKKSFREALDHIENLETNDEAATYLINNFARPYAWDMEATETKQLLNLVASKFQE